MEYAPRHTFLNYMKICIHELLGTAIVSMGAYYANAVPAYVTVPLAYFIAVALFGRISGAHCNPAITLGVYIANTPERIKCFILLLLVIISQVAGAFVGVAYGRAIKGEFDLPNPEHNIETFFNELLFSGIFVCVVVTRKSKKIADGVV